MTGLSTHSRVCSLMMLNTSVTGFIEASARVHPVNSSATAFMNVILPAISVAMTASPMLARVVAQRCSLSCRAISAFLSLRHVREHDSELTGAGAVGKDLVVLLDAEAKFSKCTGSPVSATLP